MFAVQLLPLIALINMSCCSRADQNSCYGSTSPAKKKKEYYVNFHFLSCTGNTCISLQTIFETIMFMMDYFSLSFRFIRCTQMLLQKVFLHLRNPIQHLGQCPCAQSVRCALVTSGPLSPFPEGETGTQKHKIIAKAVSSTLQHVLFCANVHQGRF